MKKKTKTISAITIILIIISVFLLINTLYIANNVNNKTAMCDLLIEDINAPQEYRYMEADGITSCIASEWDSKNNLATTFYIMLVSILLTLLSWNVDKIKKK